MKRRKRGRTEARSVWAAVGAAVTAAASYVAYRLLRRRGRGPEPRPEGAGLEARRRATPETRARAGTRSGAVPQGRVMGPAPGPGYEPRDWSYRWVLIAGAALVGLLALAFVVTTLLQFAVTGLAPRFGAPPGIADEPRVTLPAPPVLQADPLAQINALRAEEAETLSTYGWVDPAAGIVRLPITRAMQLLAERGLPVAPQPAEGRESRPMDSNSGRMTEVAP